MARASKNRVSDREAQYGRLSLSRRASASGLLQQNRTSVSSSPSAGLRGNLPFFAFHHGPWLPHTLSVSTSPYTRRVVADSSAERAPPVKGIRGAGGQDPAASYDSDTSATLSATPQAGPSDPEPGRPRAERGAVRRPTRSSLELLWEQAKAFLHTKVRRGPLGV